MKPHSVVFVILLAAISVSLCSRSVANDQPLESSLNAHFANKIIIVRNFYAGEHLRFNAAGNPVGKPMVGPWTAYAMVQVKRASVKSGKLVLYGKRIMNVYNTDQCRFTNVLTDISVELEVQTNTDSMDTDQALALLAPVIATDVSTIENSVPDYWKPWFSSRKLIGKTGKEYCGTDDDERRSALLLSSAANSGTKEVQPAYIEQDGTPVFKFAPGVKPPRGVLTPDPAYTDIAKKLRFEGTTILQVVVDNKGQPTNLRIKRPLGGGLDDMAVERVKQWKFTPATYNGDPVAVEITVEVNFRLN